MEDFCNITIFYWVAMLFFLLISLFWSFIYIKSALKSKRTHSPKSLPPGPPALPIIGHLHMLLGGLPYRTLHKLSQTYGPIMQLYLGSIPIIVVSSSKVAELFLKTHDLNFSNRPKSQVSECTSLGRKGMIFSDYGPLLSNLRKLCSVHLLNASRIDSFRPLRREEVGDLIKKLKEAAEGREVVNMSAQVALAIEKITCRMLLGSGYRERFNIKPMIEECMRLANAGAANINDFLPFMKAFDFQKLTHRAKNVNKIMEEFLEKVIDEHEQDDIVHQNHHKDLISVMMSLMKSYNAHEERLDRTSIKIVIMDMLGGSWETSATTVEWALKELLRNPQEMKRVQEELANVVGMDRMVEETDLAKLSYLEMVVKESIRLHPFAPLVPRESIEDVSIKGFHIPNKSRIIFNVWSIARDPNVWSDNAEKFYPQRFVNTNIDVRGLNFQLIPFGSGRRKCPGVDLGLRTVQFVLAQLVHCFSLELPDRMSPRDVDMKEIFCGKSSPILTVPTYRLCIDNI